MFIKALSASRARQSLAMFFLAVAVAPVLAQETLYLQCKGKLPNPRNEREERYGAGGTYKLSAKELYEWDEQKGAWKYDLCNQPAPEWFRKVEPKCKWDGDVFSVWRTVLGKDDELQSGVKIVINKKTGFYSHTLSAPKSSAEFVGRCEPIAEPVRSPQENPNR